MVILKKNQQTAQLLWGIYMTLNWSISNKRGSDISGIELDAQELYTDKMDKFIVKYLAQYYMKKIKKSKIRFHDDVEIFEKSESHHKSPVTFL